MAGFALPSVGSVCELAAVCVGVTVRTDLEACDVKSEFTARVLLPRIIFVALRTFQVRMFAFKRKERLRVIELPVADNCEALRRVARRAWLAEFSVVRVCVT